MRYTSRGVFGNPVVDIIEISTNKIVDFVSDSRKAQGLLDRWNDGRFLSVQEVADGFSKSDDLDHARIQAAHFHAKARGLNPGRREYYEFMHNKLYKIQRLADMEQSAFQALLNLPIFAIESAKVSFASEIDQLMKVKGVTSDQLARTLGVGRSMVVNLLRGDTNVTIETMVKVCTALGGKLSIKVDSTN